MAAEQNVGKIVEIKGVVLDAVFDGAPAGASTTRSRSTLPATAAARILIAEVQQHLGDDRVRAVAMDATDGLARGSAVYDTGGLDHRPGRRGDARPHLQRAGRRRSTRSDGTLAIDRAALGDPPRAAAPSTT